MPFATAAGIAAIGAGVGAAGSIIGGSMQSSAVNSSSKAAARAQEEARNIAQANLTNVLTTVGPRLEEARDVSRRDLVGSNAEANRQLTVNYGTAAGAIDQGYDLAGRDVNQGYSAAEASLGQGYLNARGYLGEAKDRIGQSTTQANELLAPYVGAGQRALGLTADLSGANGVEAGRAAMANFEHSPGYEFALDQGLRAVDAGASARGMLVSGQTRAAEQRYGQGLAAQDFASYYNRLSGLASQGLQATTTVGSNLTTGAARQADAARALAANEVDYGRGLGSLQTGRGGALSSLDTGKAAAQASIYTGLGGQLAGNEMTTGGRLGANEQQTGAAISNLYTNNATQTSQLQQATGAGLAQTAASTGSALASIYGNTTAGVTGAINSGLNNYTYMNQLGPNAQQQPQPNWNTPIPPNAQQYMTPGY